MKFQRKILDALVWCLKRKVSNCLVFPKKYANTTNISNATRRPVIVAAAVVSIRVMRNEYG